MIWLPRTTDISTYFAQSLEIRGIESRLYFLWDLCDRDRFATSCMRHYVFSFDVQCETVV